MAYNSYFPTGYQPVYYSNQYQQPPAQAPMQTPQTIPTQQPTGNSLIWVQGEAGAKSYLVAPNTTQMLMDSESDVFYLKSTDASGMPLPLRIFDYKERQKTADSEAKILQRDNSPDYVTKAEFEAFKGQIEAMIPAPKPKKEKVNEQ